MGAMHQSLVSAGPRDNAIPESHPNCVENALTPSEHGRQTRSVDAVQDVASNSFSWQESEQIPQVRS